MNPRPAPCPHSYFSLWLVLGLLVAGPAVAQTAFQKAAGKFLHKDVDVISVTDMTDAGRAYAPATPAKPVYYKLVYFGYTHFDGTRVWAGESIPKNKDVLVWMIEAMRAQGYLVADAAHPPEQLLVFSWGMMEGGKDRPALGFLGGDKLNLMWEQVQYGGFVDPRVLLRGMIRTGVAGKVWDIAESDLFLGAVRSFTLDAMENPNPTLLWETRFGCPATGLAMDQAMPLLVAAAAMNLGRETAKPVTFNATEAFAGNVTLGEFKFLGEADTLPGPTPPPEPDPAAK
jgi:hypothetical protein